MKKLLKQSFLFFAGLFAIINVANSQGGQITAGDMPNSTYVNDAGLVSTPLRLWNNSGTG